MKFIRVNGNDANEVKSLSLLATSIIRDYYEPLLGKAQNEYMINLFQSEEGILNQIHQGYIYYKVNVEDIDIGFFAYKVKDSIIYLSKLYLEKHHRGKGYSKEIIAFLTSECRRLNKEAIELNVNKYNESIKIYEKLGFIKIRDEVNYIGHGYVMDDYVYSLNIK